MVNTNMWHHPKYYEELRKKRKELESSLDPEAKSNKPQASSSKHQASSSKQQAIDETVPHCDIEEAASSKPQASSDKL